VSVPAQLGTRRLLTVLGVAFGLAVTVGNTIGAGIVRTPGAIASYLPEFWPFLSVWVIGAIYALLGVNALAELGTMVPRSGGQYVFVRRGLGNYAGFIVGWSDWLSTCGTAALVAIVVGDYAVGLIPELRTQQVVALAIVAALTCVQWFSVRSGAVLQDATTVIKGLVLLLFIAACFVLGNRNPLESTMQPDREITLFVAVILSLQAVIYTYDGWAAPIYFSEEFREPGRSIPRAMFSGLAVVTLIYLLINIAFVRVVPIPTLAGKNLAAGAVTQHLFGVHGDTVLRTIMVLALLSTINSCILMAPRVIFAMGNDGLFWRGAREVNRGGTPDVALLISSILAAAFIITGTFEAVIAKLAFFFVANYTLSFLTLFVLRRREPDTPRPYRAWGHPLTTGIALTASVVFLAGAVIADTRNTLWAVGLLFLSFPAYLLVRQKAESRRQK
jgi:APA family basic amino acid/polyamine antiporter